MNNVFISYSHLDEVWKDRVQSHLTVLEKHGKLCIWDDRKIPLGGDWLDDIQQSLERANIALLLVSRHFLNSDFIQNTEIPKLLQRREQNGLKVIPVMLSSCSWDHVDWLSTIQGYPKDNKPLSGLTEHEVDEALAKLASHLPKNGASLNDINIIETLAKPIGDEAQNVIINNFSGITLEQYEEGLLRQEKRIREEFRRVIGEQDSTKETALKAEMDAVQNKLFNLESTYEETQERLREADDALEQLKNELPALQIEKARELLAKNETQSAKQAFNDIIDKGTPSMALAAYESGKLEEEDINYTKAMKQYCIAVTLEDNNPDYLSAAGMMARILGDYPAALNWLLSLKQIHSRSDDNYALSEVQRYLGWVYYDMGEYDTALPLFTQSLYIRENSKNKDYDSITSTLNNLAGLYRVQGNYKKAMLLYSRSLNISDKHLKKNHSTSAATLNNLGGLYRALGEYEKAELLYKRSLYLTKSVFGNNHPCIASCREPHGYKLSS